MDERERLVTAIKDIAAEVTASKSKVNRILELLGHLENEDSNVSDAAQRALVKVFVWFLQTKEMVDVPGDTTALTEYRQWLGNCFKQTRQSLLDIIIGSDSKASQTLALTHLLRLLAVEGKYPLQNFGDDGPDRPYFPVESLKAICSTLLSGRRDMGSLIDKLQEPIETYDDFKFFTMKCLSQLLKERRDQTTDSSTAPESGKEESDVEDDEDTYVRNAHSLLSLIQLPILGRRPKRKKGQKRQKTDGNDEDQSDNEISAGELLCEPINFKWPKFSLDYESAADYFASAWLSLLAHKIPTPLYRKILLKMDEKIMPHFRNPLTLTDFLVNSFSVGGSVSLLALSSLFILIQKCNLEYPEFYTKLYSMLEPNILYVKYRAKFFFWADIFMTSTHLPAYLVAAFVKRASRIALAAPVDALTILIPFIANLLIRHKDLVESLINRTEASGEADPFDNDAANPAESRAMESTLWELKSLQSHWHPQVASAACFINKTLPLVEFDLADVLDNNFDEMLSEMMDRELKARDLTNIDSALADRLQEQFFGLTATS